MHAVFVKIAGADEKVDAYELRKALQQSAEAGDDTHEASLVMMKLVDKDGTGELDEAELTNLLEQLTLWKVTRSLFIIL